MHLHQVVLGRNWRVEPRLVELLELRGRHAVDFLPSELAHEMLPLVDSERDHIVARSHHMRRQKDQQIELGRGAGVVAEEIADHRDVREKGHALARGIRFIRDEPADYRRAMVLHENTRRG